MKILGKLWNNFVENHKEICPYKRRNGLWF